MGLLMMMWLLKDGISEFAFLQFAGLNQLAGGYAEVP